MKRILVVDDSDDLLELFTDIFSINNYQIKTASLKEEVFELIQSFQPQLILLDVILKACDGREICREIKALHNHIPVILMSANKNNLERYADCKADDIIEKPFEMQDLLDKVKKFV